MIYWILRTVHGGGFRRFCPPTPSGVGGQTLPTRASAINQGQTQGDQEFPEQTVKIVWKRVARNFGGGGHQGV